MTLFFAMAIGFLLGLVVMAFFIFSCVKFTPAESITIRADFAKLINFLTEAEKAKAIACVLEFVTPEEKLTIKFVSTKNQLENIWRKS